MSLYNEVRPVRLSEVVGQDATIGTLSAQVRKGQMFPVYIFTGTKGCGKTTTARIIARIANCSHPTPEGEACGTCPACRSIMEGTCSAVMELDAATNGNVDSVQGIIADTKYAVPAGLRKKVYIIDECHMLSNAAWNALLKTLEEPPEGCMFILCTTELNKVPATIKSRAQRFNFRSIELDVIAGRLQEILEERKFPYEMEAVYSISMEAGGSLRDAIKLLEQVMVSVKSGEKLTDELVISSLGIPDTALVFRILKAAACGDGKTVAEGVDEMKVRGTSAGVFCQYLVQALTDIIRIKQAGEGSVTNYPEYVKNAAAAAEAFSSGNLFRLVHAVVDARKMGAEEQLYEFLIVELLHTSYEESRLDLMEREIVHLKDLIVNRSSVSEETVSASIAMESGWEEMGPDEGDFVPATGEEEIPFDADSSMSLSDFRKQFVEEPAAPKECASSGNGTGTGADDSSQQEETVGFGFDDFDF